MTPTRRGGQGNEPRPEDRDHDGRIKATNLTAPNFRWVVTGARTIEARAYFHNTGDASLRMPFRPLSGTTRLPFVSEQTTALAFDLNTSGLGGLVDGIAIASEADLLCWAFLAGPLDTTIYGVGVTTRPRLAIPITTGVVSGGGLGTTAVFALTTAGHANRVTVDSRVLIYEADTAGSNYNQGTITVVDTSLNRITVLLDATYGLGANSNTTLAGAAAKTLVQLNNFEPRAVSETTSVFSGKPFVYIGSVHLNTSSNIRYCRQRGDYLELPATYVPVTATGVTASASAQTGLGNWLPMAAKDVYCILASNITAGTPGQSRVLIAPDSASRIAIDNRNFIGGNLGFNLQVGFIEQLQPSGSIFFQYIETGTLTVSYTLSITKYRETQW